MADNDFEFDLGKGRRLRGKGPRGLIALALYLSPQLLTLALICWAGYPFAAGAISRLIFALEKLR